MRRENAPDRKFASTWYRTHNHQVLSPTRSLLSHPGEEEEEEEKEKDDDDNNDGDDDDDDDDDDDGGGSGGYDKEVQEEDIPFCYSVVWTKALCVVKSFTVILHIAIIKYLFPYMHVCKIV